MDEEKSEEIFSGIISIEDFDDNSKDMNLNKKTPPSPADDFDR